MTELAQSSGLAKISGGVYEYLKAVHDAKHCSQDYAGVFSLIDLIYKHKLTREQVPTWGLVDMDVLSALLLNKEKTRVVMPMTALLRNLGNLTAYHVLDDDITLQVLLKHLLQPDIIKFTHIHPVTALLAWFNYKNGGGKRGHNNWTPIPQLVNILEEIFYLSFKNVTPTGKRICFLIDCSGSMSGPSLCEGISNAEAAALLAMIFARSETSDSEIPAHAFYLFTSSAELAVNTIGYYGYHGHGHKSDSGLMDVSDVIDANANLDTVLKVVQRSDWAATDISLGILEALKYKRKYDAFVVITDNDVNSGIKPKYAMQQYRDGMKLPKAKLAVIATQHSDYTIADPDDPYMMDFCGFDSHGPKILQEFIAF
jgi:60 kDa SS-A/Ro ribonucleoprotein